ncbi:MAG: hypothetical protein IT557_17315 [Alphaproteobacteria bacterium]|nr:hypothetical protein [Alphaproteobacteria bacterium]
MTGRHPRPPARTSARTRPPARGAGFLARLVLALGALLFAAMAVPGALPGIGPGVTEALAQPARNQAGRSQAADPASAPYNDLARHEGKAGYNPRGAGISRGHTIARHVGKSDRELLDRLRQFPNLRAASSYPDRMTAQRAINATLADPRNAERVRRWLADARQSDPLALTRRFNDAVGRMAERGRGVRDARGARVVLIKDGQGGYTILTSYPDE